ncbi:hypothetical protein AAFF_G00309490 [Aldrovandia affinis]|uniref:Uncharacterized protein n=1 Tax=Aldrovandia affinis TaxID=143900 RepID=A0AAD7WQV0_9TELE|nr:hypothetical protein AAFF_G00309490 [Aldrovandia affinis]
MLGFSAAFATSAVSAEPTRGGAPNGKVTRRNTETADRVGRSGGTLSASMTGEIARHGTRCRENVSVYGRRNSTASRAPPVGERVRRSVEVSRETPFPVPAGNWTLKDANWSQERKMADSRRRLCRAARAGAEKKGGGSLFVKKAAACLLQRFVRAIQSGPTSLATRSVTGSESSPAQ